MSDVDALKTELKKLSAKAMQLKMDLHDLSEELPQNWQNILTVAQQAYDAFAVLERKRGELQKLGS
ncbi:MAG TPA: CCE_0567 family metalloprotein [Polyangiaceae bacterium]|nr:CCE_0567 family metalloprotein [Polyangiaceae bacterium]